MSHPKIHIKCSALFILFFLFTTCCITAQIKSYKKTGFGISCSLNTGSMNIYLLKDDIVEVKYTSLNNMAPKQSLVVLPVTSYAKNFSVAEKDNNIIITTAKIKISINKNNAGNYIH